MKENFDRCLAMMFEVEGGLSDRASDRGGLTNRGISLRFGRMIGLTEDDILDMTEERAAGLYRVHFWDLVRGDDLPIGLDLCVFGSAVNQSPDDAARMLQRAVRAKADGIIGSMTLAAVAFRENVIDLFMAERVLGYIECDDFDENGRGWSRRLFKVHREAMTMERGAS